MQRPQTPGLVDLIAEELAQHPPRRVLLMGMSWPELPPPPQLEVRDLDEALARGKTTGQRADVALLLLPDHGLDGALRLRQDLASLLACLRDLGAARVLVALSVAAQGPARDAQCQQLRSLGFSLQGRFQHQRRSVFVHRFDVADYKPTPKWLNPNNWAHPERWNRHRW